MGRGANKKYKGGRANRKAVREKLWKHGHRNCFHCGMQLVLEVGEENTLTADHLVPLSTSGTNLYINFVSACAKCNNDRMSSMTEKVLKEIEKRDLWSRISRHKLRLERKRREERGGGEAQKSAQ